MFFVCENSAFLHKCNNDRALTPPVGHLGTLWFFRAERDARRPSLGVGALLDGAVFRMCCVAGSRAGVGTSLPAGEGSSS